MLNSTEIKRIASEMGFSDCGIARTQRLDDEFFPLQKWLSMGCHADMHYMERNAYKRQDVRLLVEGAQSVISLLVAYKPDRLLNGDAKIAQYAYGEDYHLRLKRMMHGLIERLKGLDESLSARAFVDTAPISDRHWAVLAGLGRLGKNSLFFHPRFGSYCFIGEIVTSASFDCYDSPQPDALSAPCGDCNLCVESCPNHALIKISDIAYGVDARRCTSYNTIENRSDELPADLDTRGYLFGCDICQIVCPRNRNVPAAYTLDDKRMQMLEKLPMADEECFLQSTRQSAMNRVSYAQWRRNCSRNG